MSDDTRQARIAAGVRAFWEAGPGSAQTDIDEYDFADVLRARFAAGLVAADAVGRERVSAEMVNAAVEAFNAVTQQRTGKSLYGTWWPYEYLPAMKAALESALLTAAPAERGHDETGGEAMTRQRTSAEIEAGARAIYQNRSQTRWAWEELEQKQRDHFIAVAKDALAAADAAAAPAVGVTVDADMLLKWRQVVNFSIQHITDDEWQSRLNRVMQEMSEVTRELRHRTVHPPFLLTAQPDPGTHDDAGQPAEGGVFIPKREDWKP